jgi:YHS domain-containing protein
MQRGVPFREETNDVDPVCGMVVFTAGNHLSAFRRGRRYYFCSKGCMDRFYSEKVQKGARK